MSLNLPTIVANCLFHIIGKIKALGWFGGKHRADKHCQNSATLGVGVGHVKRYVR